MDRITKSVVGKGEPAPDPAPMTDKTMREKIAKMEQVVIAAMTCHGQYQVEDAGEHATEIVKAFLAIPEIKEGQELLEKAESGKLVNPEELAVRILAFIESYLVTTVHPEGNMHHIDDKEWESVKVRALRIKPVRACKGINCEQYTYRCIAYGEPADNCPLASGEW